MGKNDNLILYAGAGVLAYFLLKDSFKGVEKATTGLGTGISEISQGISSPWSLIDTSLGAKETQIIERTNTVKDVYRNNPTVKEVITNTIVSTEQAKQNKATVTEKRTENKADAVSFKTDTNVQARSNNFKETVDRKTEYGTSVKQFLAKTFLPTNEVAQERRDAVKSTIKGAISTVKNVLKKKK